MENVGVGFPDADAGREVARIGARLVPPGVDHEQLDGEISRSVRQ
jgi:hypothetical protein